MDIYENKEQKQEQAQEPGQKKIQTGPVIKEKKTEGKKAEGKKTAALVLILAAAVFVLIFSAGSLLKQKLHTAAKKIKNNSLNKVASQFQKGKEYTPDTYLLEGVICDGDQSYAVINGTVIRLNEQIDGLELIKVFSSGVELKDPDTGATLSLSL